MKNKKSLIQGKGELLLKKQIETEENFETINDNFSEKKSLVSFREKKRKNYKHSVIDLRLAIFKEEDLSPKRGSRSLFLQRSRGWAEYHLH